MALKILLVEGKSGYRIQVLKKTLYGDECILESKKHEDYYAKLREANQIKKLMRGARIKTIYLEEAANSIEP